MVLLRLWRYLPVALVMVGVAVAGPLAIYQPSQQDRASPELEDRSAPDQYGNPFLWSCLADLTRGQIALAEQACSRAIGLDSKEASAYQLRGYAYLLEHRFELAEADFLVALKLKPNDPETLAGYGQSLSGLGQFGAAVVQFSKAVALDPRKAAYRSALCWARGGTGKNLEHAIADCNAALDLAPGMPGPLNGRALAELRMARHEAAIADYTASLAANIHQPSAYFGRGLAKLALHQDVAGNADILSARDGDSEIDSLFVTLGVLRPECAAGDKTKCPAGFPLRGAAGKWLVARWLTP